MGGELACHKELFNQPFLTLTVWHPAINKQHCAKMMNLRTNFTLLHSCAGQATIIDWKLSNVQLVS